MTRRLALGALLAFAGCGGFGASAPSMICETGECDTTLTDEVLVAEVDSSLKDTRLVRQEFTTATVDQEGQLVLRMIAPVELSGTVRLRDGVTYDDLAATVTATRKSRIAGRPDMVYETTSDASNGRFSLWLPPTLAGERYTVRVVALSTQDVPPQIIELPIAQDQRVDLTFDDPRELTELTGFVRDAAQRGVAHMRVQALHPTTGTLVSSVGVTVSDGVYRVRLSPSIGAQEVLLVARPDETMTTMVSLSKRVDVSAVDAGSALDVDLTLPALPLPTRVKLPILGIGPSGAPMAIEGAQCILHMITDDAEHEVRVESKSDDKGSSFIEADLFPLPDGGSREYSLSVTTPATALFESLAGSKIDVGPIAGIGTPIELAIRPKVTGQVLGPTGLPIVGAQVTSRVTLATSQATTLGAGPAGTTDTDGRFSLLVDRGTYDFAVVPQTSATLPRVWAADTSVQRDTYLDVAVPRPVLVTLNLLTPQGQPAANLNVRLYSVATRNTRVSCASESGCLTPARLRSDGTTSTTGLLNVLLPASN